MSVNRARPHLYIVPEDDADRQLANGFTNYYEVNGQVQVVNEAGGWLKVIKIINDEYVPLLRQYQHAHVLGIIDCDNHEDRIQDQLAMFPNDVRDRIFLIGVIDDPQQFKRSVQMHFEKIGETLAEECFTDALILWNHEQLQHISAEIERAKIVLRSIIFA